MRLLFSNDKTSGWMISIQVALSVGDENALFQCSLDDEDGIYYHACIVVMKKTRVVSRDEAS